MAADHHKHITEKSYTNSSVLICVINGYDFFVIKVFSNQTAVDYAEFWQKMQTSTYTCIQTPKDG